MMHALTLIGVAALCAGLLSPGSTVAAQAAGVIAVVGAPIRHGDALYNCAVILAGGRAQGARAARNRRRDLTPPAVSA